MIYNLKNYILLKEYCSKNRLSSMKILRDKKIVTIKIGKNRFILRNNILNMDIQYTNLTNLYPIGAFFTECGMSKSYNQSLDKQNKKIHLITIFNIKFIKLNSLFYRLIEYQNRTPYIINKHMDSAMAKEIINLNTLKIGFLE